MLEKFIAMQNKRRKKGGFTLVELIVVLVILAILAALLIPALTGYIDKAKEKSIIAETRQVVMAAQTLYDEQYGTLALDDTNNITFGESTTGNNVATIAFSEVTKLAEVKGTIKEITVGEKDTSKTDANKISAVQYENNGKTCIYTLSDGQYKIS